MPIKISQPSQNIIANINSLEHELLMKHVSKLPFEDINMDCKIIAQKVVNLNPEYPEEFFGDKSKKLVELLEQMLEKNDNKRIDIDGFLKNSWFDIIKKEK